MITTDNNPDAADEAQEDAPKIGPDGRPEPKYEDREIENIINTQLSNSLGSTLGDIGQIRLKNLQFYKAEPIGELQAPEVEDRSSLVASDVSDTVDGMIPQLMKMFVSSDAVSVNAKAAQYENGADQAKEYLLHTFHKRNNGFQVLHTLFKDALVQKVGFCEVRWDKVSEDTVENYEGLTQAQVIMLGQDPEIKIEGMDLQETIDIAGQPTAVYHVQARRINERGYACIDSVPPEQMRIHRTAIYGKAIPFIARERFVTAAELEELGIDADDYSADESYNAEMIERHAESKGYFASDTTEELKRYRYTAAYMKLDQNNDGVPELLLCHMVSEKLAKYEQVVDDPFIYFCPIPSPHVFFGDCPADRAMEPQRLNTSLIRAIADSAYLSVNNRHQVLEGKVNLADMTDSRPGGLVRVTEMGAVQSLNAGGLDPAAWKLVEWGEQWKQRRTGFFPATAGLDADAINKTAYGTNIQVNKQDAQIELIARIAAESVRTMFKKLLRLMSMYQDIPETVKLTGGWVDVNPRQWYEMYEISIDVGLGTGNKDERARNGQMLLNVLEKFIMNKVYDATPAIKVARDMAKAVGYDKPELIFPDFVPPPPQPTPVDPKLEEIKLNHSLELQRIQMETASKEKIAMAEITARQNQSLLELASGVLASRFAAAGHITNLTNGSQLDQTAQQAGFTMPDLSAVMTGISELSNQIRTQNGG